MVTDSGGNVKARYDYLPFGDEIGALGGRSLAMGYGGSDMTRQKFTQKERDGDSNLDYFLARYYSSKQGRFTSTDPADGEANEPAAWNRYTYALNSPLKYTDPDGEKWAVQWGDGQAEFRWYTGDSIPSDWVGTWEEYTGAFFVGANAVIHLGGRGPDDFHIIEKSAFVGVGGGDDNYWRKIQNADPAKLTHEEKEIILAAYAYYPDRAESLRKMAIVSEMGAYLIAGLVKPGPLGRSPKNKVPPKPGGMTNRQFNEELMKWGRTSAEARARMGTLTRAEREKEGLH